MDQKEFLSVRNCVPVRLDELKCLPLDRFRRNLSCLNQDLGYDIVSLFAMPSEVQHQLNLIVILRDSAGKNLLAGSTQVPDDSYPALTPSCPQACLFECEISEQYGVIPEGHPNLEPVRFEPRFPSAERHFSRNRRQETANAVHEQHFPEENCSSAFESRNIHSITVGPVHGKITEPGYFHFLCHGEKVLSLKIRQGYQHRGIERHLAGGPNLRTLPLLESISGDSCITYASAYADLMEGLCSRESDRKAWMIRAFSMELERAANHILCLADLAKCIAFQRGFSRLEQLHEACLELTALLCGNRSGRNLVVPGGARFDLDKSRISEIASRLKKILIETGNAADLMFSTSSVTDRFQGIGRITNWQCRHTGLSGPVARSCGINRDLRRDLPYGAYRIQHPSVCIESQGDVLSRMRLFHHEAISSVQYMQTLLENLSRNDSVGKTSMPEIPAALPPNRLIVSMTEGFRGEICLAAVTDSNGRFARFKITDPFFRGFLGLELVMRNEEISNFPICSRSFHLSHCGHDL